MMALDSMLAYVSGVSGADRAEKAPKEPMSDDVYILGTRYSHEADAKAIGRYAPFIQCPLRLCVCSDLPMPAGLRARPPR